MEIIAAAVGSAFIVLVIFLIRALQRLCKLAKKAEHVLTEVQHVLYDISEPSIELIDNANKVVLDVKKKAEGLDVIFRPLYDLKKHRSDGHNGFEKIGGLLEYIAQGIQIFSKIKNELKS
jgi:uncharacterized protein YoxC